MDSQSGDIYLDEYNNTVPVGDDRGFMQVLDGLFRCDLNSEPMNPLYGFDLKSAMRESSVPDSEMFIESLVAQALNPQIEKLISKVDYIKAERSSTEERTMNVTIVVTSILNDTITSEIEVGS